MAHIIHVINPSFVECAVSVQALFKPFQLGTLQLSTRVVMAPMTRSFSPGGVPNAKVIEYYRRRAAAGWC